MNKPFHFNDNALELSINDTVYQIDLKEQKITDAFETLHQNAFAISQKEAEESVLYEELLTTSSAFLQQVLGKEAYESIFMDRTSNLMDQLDLIRYIASAIRSYKKERLSSFLPEGFFA